MLASGLGRSIVRWALLAAVVVGGGSGGCESPDHSGGESTESASETSSDDSSTTAPPAGEAPVVAEAGPVEVTLEDYQRFLRQSRLFAPAQGSSVPEVPARRKMSPRAQLRTVRTLLEHAAIRQLAERRALTATDREIEAYLRESDDLSRFVAAPDAGEEAALELPETLSRETLREVARIQVLRRRLREALLADLESEDLWRIYQRRHDTVRIAYVSVPNSPRPDSIDQFLEQTDSSQIQSYFEQHADRYRKPKLVRLAVVRPPAGEEVDEATLTTAAEKLADGVEAETVADELGLEAEREAYLVRKENREAFGADKGATGYQTDGPRGAYAWRVEGWREGGKPTLDRALRREVAADMMRESVVPSVLRKLTPALMAMRNVERGNDGSVSEEALSALEGNLEERGLTLETPDAFSRAADGRVPGLGLAESVFEAAFELEADSPVVDKPVLSRGRAVAVMRVERNRPDREAFEADREEFRQTIVEEKKDLVVDEVVARWLSEHEADIDLGAVRDKYGVMKKGR